MPNVEIKLLNTQISLEVDNPERLKELVLKFNNRLMKLGSANSGSSDHKLALIAGLLLEDELSSLQEKLSTEQTTKSSHMDQLKNSFEDTITQIAEYIDQLAESIEKK